MFSRFSTMFNPGRSRGHSYGQQSPCPSPSKRPCTFRGDDDNGKQVPSPQASQVDNSVAVIQKIAALYAERLMCDITLVINDVEFPAHRLILCASSDVFQVMLMNSNWNEAKGNRVHLVESPECGEYFEDFLKYFYTGKVKLDLNNTVHLLTLADKYNVKDLTGLCLEYMLNHIPGAGAHNQLIHWFQYTASCGHRKIANACRNFIKWNFEMMSKTEDFPHLDVEPLVSILNDDDIVIYDEFYLFMVVDAWISSQCQKDSDSDSSNSQDLNFEASMLQTVETVIACIRFPMMSPRQLADLILFPLTQKYKEPLLEKMAIGMSFHSGVVDQHMSSILAHPNRSKLFLPRLYTTEKWSVSLGVETFSMMPHYQSKTLVFNTPQSFSENDGDANNEWVVDLYAKGVWFAKCYLIDWRGTIEVPEHVIPTLRLSVMCKTDGDTDTRVHIGIMISGLQDGVEHIRSVVRRNYIFTEKDKILNLNDLLPYGELTRCATCNVHNKGAAYRMTPEVSHVEPPKPNCCAGGRSFFLVGRNADSLRIKIVITPMSEFQF